MSSKKLVQFIRKFMANIEKGDKSINNIIYK